MNMNVRRYLLTVILLLGSSNALAEPTTAASSEAETRLLAALERKVSASNELRTGLEPPLSPQRRASLGSRWECSRLRSSSV
ncbi:MAG: hypothetical protein HC923_08865 [Myxococcales bacterium]|nr:hypothetical protein [Myxococcales bacterium]